MKGNFQKDKVRFTQVANEVLLDSSLSLKAKGMYAYLFSKPDDWDFETNRIAKENMDGRDSVRNTIKELENRGYLKRVKLANRKMEYILKYSIKPMTENPSLTMTEKANDGNSHSGKSRHISNIDAESNKEEESNILPAPSAEGVGNEVNKMIELFKDVNPTYEILFKRIPQRKSMERLIKKYGGEKLVRTIQILKATNSEPYFPTITTPTQLEENLGKLISKYKQRMNEKKINIINLDNI